MVHARAYAYAKINLILDVLDRRPDGYHNIWSVMQMIALHDTLDLTCRREEVPIPTNHSWPIIIECSGAAVPNGDGNLVYRAAREVMKTIGRCYPLHIRLHKRIPIGAGLGGGSSDAAATIDALNVLWDLKMKTHERVRIGACIGSDVPFFFHGPTAVVCGRGETVTPFSLHGTGWVVLVKPNFQISTTWAYQRLREIRESASNDVTPYHESTSRRVNDTMWIGELYPHCWNQFASIMEEEFPDIRQARERLLTSGASAALLSGSGPTVFGLFHTNAHAKRAAVELEGHPDWQVWTTRLQTTRNENCSVSVRY